MTVEIMPGCEPYSAENGPLGVLVLHGFTGNPYTMRSLAERMAKAGYSVELPRLPGHGTSLEDLMTTDWSDWSGAALEAYDALRSRCDAVAVVGLSMGGGLTAFVAESRPDVAGCVFINPMVKPIPQELLDGLDQFIEAGVETIDGNGSDIKSEDEREFEAAYSAMPLEALRTLFAGVAAVNADLDRIAAPSLLLTSREDHTINWDRAEDLMTMVTGPISQIWLEDSFHVATLDNDAELIESSIVAFLGEVLGS
jgi:carboxylesterase